MSNNCNCCEGNETLTPQNTTNRPGLDALKYRVGTHAAFLETMKARLSGQTVEVSPPSNPDQVERLYPLQNLTTRDVSDPSIAFLDAWATVASVLTFYQERIANEGYLRTASERRSLLELGRLVGYKPRPGVAASVYLAFTMERDFAGEVPKGTRVQSLPGPSELPQSFETSQTIPARAEWNVLKPRMSQPQNITIKTNAQSLSYIYFEGIDNNLQPGFPLLFVFGDLPDQTVVRWIERVELEPVTNRTKVFLQESTVFGASAGLSAELSPEMALASAAGPDWVKRVQSVIEKYLDLEQFGISPGKMASEVQDVLEDLRSKIGPDTTLETVKAFLEESLLALQEKHAMAVEKEYSQLEPWLGAMVQEFEAILTGLSQDSATNADSTATDVQAGFESSTHYGGHYGNGDYENNGGDDGNGNGHGDEGNNGQKISPPSILDRLNSILEQLSKPPKEQVRSAPYLKQAVHQLFDQDADTLLEMIQSFQPNLASTLYSALQNLPAVQQKKVRVYALRVCTAPFGFNAQKQAIYSDTDQDGIFTVRYEEWTRVYPRIIYESIGGYNDCKIWLEVPLDTVYNQIKQNSWAIIIFPPGASQNIVYRITQTRTVFLSEYNLAGNITQLSILLGSNQNIYLGSQLDFVRKTTVYAQSEELTVANEPLAQPIGPSVGMKTEEEVNIPKISSPPPGSFFDQVSAVVSESDQTNDSEASGNIIELDGVYDGLKPGRWLIVTGQRADLIDEFDNVITGVQTKELVMLAGVKQLSPEIPGDTPHTVLILDKPLAYTYKRDTVEIYGNVVEATHGETKEEVLGSGDGSKAFQTFTLGKSPLTYTAAPTAAGVDSTLTVRVNDVRWREADNLAELGPEDRRFITRTNNESITSVVFGNGERGRRLPSGIENVKALYRFGIGQPGNVAAGQIKLVAGRPLGVKGVLNPLPASGGADREGPNQIRRNAALAVQALDRLVSARDYEYFARAFAGVEKAYAAVLSDGQCEYIHLSIAGQNGNAIAETSQLYRNLQQALRRHGDPQQSFVVANRRLKLLFIEARVFIHPDYLWEVVAAQLRTALLDTFSFERRNLGQDALGSEVISTIQAVAGVLYVDLDKFDAVSEGITPEGLKTLAASLTLRSRIPADLTFVEPLIHEVQPGEWLLKIARQYGTTLEKLVYLNDITTPNLIRPGDKLLISPKNIIRPAEIVYLTPAIENTLILNLGNAA